MTIFEATVLIIVSLAVPWAVQLIKTKAVEGNAARWMAIALSILAGIATGLIAGIPTDVSAWVTCIFACVGSVQVAYAMFRAVGITSKWLDALGNVSITKK